MNSLKNLTIKSTNRVSTADSSRSWYFLINNFYFVFCNIQRKITLDIRIIEETNDFSEQNINSHIDKRVIESSLKERKAERAKTRKWILGDIKKVALSNKRKSPPIERVPHSNENSIFVTVKNDCPNKLPTVKRLKKVDDNDKRLVVRTKRPSNKISPIRKVLIADEPVKETESVRIILNQQPKPTEILQDKCEVIDFIFQKTLSEPQIYWSPRIFENSNKMDISEDTEIICLN